ncbi:MAG: 2-oxo acid dehydrogenase subunit E2 [Rhodospirillaceae bacterium]|jgi:pyruvate/2-oxoglutarate dehydrogenase complex dihydrolipoamide acyltransferase (E2) component|nr:2-oxo acid dehydrogenase subunit E2 [Rhodospirillaceae bacterium]MBT3492051.1 2-oxo acid dehydrogenase subunit E2 [Rhodospirillaceae bacterium]MBT3974961.1 2-oxo acid dehydrogenase subunit E2 [Rhodospirillaceae bacterium]MBT4167499.1 2-oxo acid dehydrogenase subunit E2 [Rhodospirillaceae bacterium]MBT4563322.1 2-oxo acid dehydrogenase subunit E2 [Rhodospirillaceae bacterium]
MFEFKLPDVGEGIHEAELLEWRVAPGDRVKEGDEIAVINTDKITVELPSPRTGVITAIHGDVGDVIEVGTVLVEIASEDSAQGTMDAPATATALAPPQKPAGRTSARAAKDIVVAAPAVRRLAKERGVDLTALLGSGQDGRILPADVEAAASTMTAEAPAAEASSMPRRLPLTGARAVAARHLTASLNTAATTTTSFEAMGDGLAQAMAQHGISPLPLIAKCLCAALCRHTRFNATIDQADGALLPHDGVDLGIAMAAKDGLVVPVFRGLDKSSPEAAATAIDAMAARARAGDLQTNDLQGGSFTLSSTGGLEQATIISTRPIINPPQTAILWVSRIVARPRIRAGVLEAGPMLALSLSFDHRYIDGAEATYFINDLVAFLEAPETALR